jgi:hypothetical protein
MSTNPITIPIEPIVHRTERSPVLRALDIPGKIPVLNFVVGPIRATAAALVGVGSKLVGICSKGLAAATKKESIKKFSKKCAYVTLRSKHEACRGLFETFGLMIILELDKRLKNQEREGRINDIVHGKYVYTDHDSIAYSKYPIDSSSKLKEDKRGENVFVFNSKNLRRAVLINKLNKTNPLGKGTLFPKADHQPLNKLIAEYLV